MPFSSSWRRDVTDSGSNILEKHNLPYEYLRDNSINENEKFNFLSSNEPTKPRQKKFFFFGI